MIIDFRTEYHGSDEYEPNERHTILVDGVEKIGQCEWMEPEDVRFFRDLTSPHECEDILHMAVEAAKRGEVVEFINSEVRFDE